MKYKTNKLIKLEKGRYSILTNDLEHCYICRQSPVDIHEIYGGSNRKVSMANGFCIPLCRVHHKAITNKRINDLQIKKDCQETYEQSHTRDEFMRLIGKNFLD